MFASFRKKILCLIFSVAEIWFCCDWCECRRLGKYFLFLWSKWQTYGWYMWLWPQKVLDCNKEMLKLYFFGLRPKSLFSYCQYDIGELGRWTVASKSGEMYFVLSSLNCLESIKKGNWKWRNWRLRISKNSTDNFRIA